MPLHEKLFSGEKFAILGNMAMSEAIASNRFAIYIGATKLALKGESLRWMTARGAQNQSGTGSAPLCTQAEETALCLSTRTAHASP
jgi:hypothetical protein